MKSFYQKATFIAAFAYKAQAQEVYERIGATLDGAPLDLYVQHMWWSQPAQISSDDSTLTMSHNTRMFLSTSPTKDVDAYFKPNLLGGYMEFDTEISQKNCSCVAALYTIIQPGRKIDGSLNDQDHWYCDANKVDGTFCPEFDIMEANKYAWHTTAHKCNEPNQFGYYSDCDRPGNCMVDIPNDADYGPGSGHKINTEQQFHVRQYFNADETTGEFSGYTTVLSQGSNEVVLNMSCPDYLKHMTADLVNGMSFAMSSWNPDSPPTWLQGNKCSGSCDTSGSHTFSNLAFVTNSDYTPPDHDDEDGTDGNPDGDDDGIDDEDGTDGNPDGDDDGTDGSDDQIPQDGHMGFNWGNQCSGNVELCLVDPNC